jgi:hypothetical protein
VVVHVPLQRPLRRFRVAVERQLPEHRCRHDRGGTCQKASARKFSHA